MERALSRNLVQDATPVGRGPPTTPDLRARLERDDEPLRSPGFRSAQCYRGESTCQRHAQDSQRLDQARASFRPVSRGISVSKRRIGQGSDEVSRPGEPIRGDLLQRPADGRVDV